MALNIRNPEADALARRLARFDQTTITAAVLTALKETLQSRLREESPSETAKQLLARHGLAFKPGRKPVSDSVWQDVADDLATRE